MHIARILLFVLCFTVSACSSSLYRSPDGSSLISLHQPPFSVTSNLPLLANADVSAFLKAENSFQVVPVWLSMYGSKNLQDPLSIIAFSTVPNNNIWIWDYARISPPDSQNLTKASFDTKEFYGKTYKLHGARDAFTLWLSDEDTAKKTYWLVERYSILLDFRQNKLILEYREPFPPSLFDLTSIPENDPIIVAFKQRAYESFTVHFTNQPQEPQSTNNTQYTVKLNTKHLDRFLGSISLRDFYWPDGVR